MREVFLLPLRVGSVPPNVWLRQLSGALRTAAATDPMSRVLLCVLGASAAGESAQATSAHPPDEPLLRSSLTPEMASLLSRVYNCTPADAARLDLVPLLLAGGWRLEKAATLDQVSALLLPASAAVDAEADERAGEAGASVAETVRLICAARLEAGLPELPVCQAPLGEPPAQAEALVEDTSGGPSSEAPDGAPADPGRVISHRAVAVGGTFDRLHAGHRLLLAVAALACSGTCFVGVTGDKLLAGKANGYLLEPFEARAAAAAEFLAAVRPSLAVETSALLDPAAPPKAATMREISALVISRETAAGGARVGQMRRAQGIGEPLELVLVDLVGAISQAADAPKLSSSALRQREAERAAAEAERAAAG